jgi:hypothetical protein
MPAASAGRHRLLCSRDELARSRSASTPPEPPLPSDCCDGGCDRCVYDIYADEVDDYKQRLARWRERHPDAP